jgi:hypothetical protein
MAGPFIVPQEIFDASTMIPGIAAGVTAALPPFINAGALPAAYAPLVAAIVVGMLPYVGSLTQSASYGPVGIATGAGNAWGNYVEMFAAVPFACKAFFLTVKVMLSGLGGEGVNVAFGAPGFEIVQAPLFFFKPAVIGTTSEYCIYLPFLIPAGTRVSINMADIDGAGPLTNYAYMAILG